MTAESPERELLRRLITTDALEMLHASTPVGDTDEAREAHEARGRELKEKLSALRLEVQQLLAAPPAPSPLEAAARAVVEATRAARVVNEQCDMEGAQWEAFIALEERVDDLERALEAVRSLVGLPADAGPPWRVGASALETAAWRALEAHAYGGDMQGAMIALYQALSGEAEEDVPTQLEAAASSVVVVHRAAVRDAPDVASDARLAPLGRAIEALERALGERREAGDGE